MLACLPAPAHPVIPLLCLQMNTGPPRWETTQKMRSPSYPSPAELDAYAKKIANNPLTIQIFPNSVKVPQRKHVRRTVNGLDTSSQRHSPYSSQLSASAGLLAVLRAPLKESTVTRARGPQKAAMNLHSGPYGPQGTLNSTHMQVPSQQAPLTPSMGLQHTLPQSAPHPPALQHKGLSHPGLLQRQQSLSQLSTAQRPAYPHGLQRQQSLPQPCVPPAQHAPTLLHTLRHHDPGPPNPPHHGPPNPPHHGPPNPPHHGPPNPPHHGPPNPPHHGPPNPPHQGLPNPTHHGPPNPTHHGPPNPSNPPHQGPPNPTHHGPPNPSNPPHQGPPNPSHHGPPNPSHHGPPNSSHHGPPNPPRGGPRTALGLQTHDVHHMPQLNMAHLQTLPQTMSTVGPPTVPPGGPQPVTSRASQQGHPRGPQTGPPGGQYLGPPGPQQGPPRGAQPGGAQPGPPRGPQPGPPRGTQPGGVQPVPAGGQYLGPPGPNPGPPRGTQPGTPGPQPGGTQQRPFRAPQPGPPGGLQSTPAGLQLGGLQTGPQEGPHPCPPGSQPGVAQQGPPRGPLPDPPGGAAFLGDAVQQPALGPFGPRKLPDADAPPNVTVSTSTIPLSMAGSLHQSRAGDLSSIVLQINQLCQARAGLGGTSVCEGQIANPSPISRNLLINASSRVAHPLAASHAPGFHMTAGPDKVHAHPLGLQLTSQPSMSAPNGLQSFHSEVEKGQSLLQRSWAHHQLAHMQQPPEGAHPCKAPRLEPPADCSFAPPQNLSYTHKVPSSAQGFPFKHQENSRASPPLCSGTSLPYMDSQYLQQAWGPPQEGPRVGLSERFPGQKYKLGKEDPGVQPKLLPNMDFLPGNFQMPRFGDQSVDMRGPRQDPGPGGPLHGHHPGYR